MTAPGAPVSGAARGPVTLTRDLDLATAAFDPFGAGAVMVALPGSLRSDLDECRGAAAEHARKMREAMAGDGQGENTE